VKPSQDTSTKDRLLASGAELFAEKGFDGVSVRQICAHASTSMNMIHHYFKSKQGLLDAIIEQYTSNVLGVPMRLLEKPARSKEDLLSRLELLFETTLEAYIEHRSLMLVVIREQTSPPALLQYMDRFAKFLEQSKKRGFVRKELDIQMVTGAMLDRILNQVQFAPLLKRTYGIDIMNDAKYRQRWCASNIDLFLHGIVQVQSRS